MDQTEVDRFREALEEERSSLRAQLVEQGADPDDPTSVGLSSEGGFADSAQTTAERARLLSLIHNLRQTLGDVKHGLRNIGARSGFGVCERCGGEIGDDRLEALPWARLCIGCKQAGR